MRTREFLLGAPFTPGKESEGICPKSHLLGSFTATRKQKRSLITCTNKHTPHFLASHLSLLKKTPTTTTTKKDKHVFLP